MKHNKVPFGVLPASWGLRGKSRLIAEAEYYHDGEELDRELAKIEAADEADLAERMLVIDVKHHKKTPFDADCIRENVTISDEMPNDMNIKLHELRLKHCIGEPYALHKKLAELKHEDEEERKLALLEVERAYQRIDDQEFEKQSATARNEPWVGIVDHGYDPHEGLNGLFIEFDWNDQWIAYLRANGYQGLDEEDLVGRWFQDLNQMVAQEEEEDGYNFVQNAPRSNRIERGNGSADYL